MGKFFLSIYLFSFWHSVFKNLENFYFLKNTILFFCLIIISCSKTEKDQLRDSYSDLFSQNNKTTETHQEKSRVELPPKTNESHKNPLRNKIVHDAQKFFGTPYVYGSTDPATGFDCSGFVYYIFHQAEIEVPRSSKDFVNYGEEIMLDDLQQGDLLIFKGTNLNSPEIGHLGIVIEPKGKQSKFIHSSSGKANGVIISSLSEAHYQARFVKAISVVKE